MFSFAFVSRIAQKVLIFSQNLVEGSTWAAEETIRFFGNLDHTMLWLWVQLGGDKCSRYILSGV